MLQENSEIKALLHLIDDPDEQVYLAVSNKILSYGTDIIPNLENMWESIQNESTLERITQLIHRVHFSDLNNNFEAWLRHPENLLNGCLIVAKYHYPELSLGSVHAELEKIKKNIWLELNNYLTPMEEVGVFNSILYNYFKLSQKELSYENPDDFLLNKILETKSGNKYGNGLLYLILCEKLDIPVKAIGIPNQFILTYLSDKTHYSNPEHSPLYHHLFFIDPGVGQMYSTKDVENYLKNNVPDYPVQQFVPLNHVQVIKILLKEIIRCYDPEQHAYKIEELQEWIRLIDQSA